MKNIILVQKWSSEALLMGWVSIPSSILFLQKELGLTSTDINVLLHLVMHWWKPNSDPHPSQETIADRMGASKRTVQRSISHMEELGLILKTRTPKDHKIYRGRNLYNLKPLVQILKEKTPEKKNNPQDRIFTWD